MYLMYVYYLKIINIFFSFFLVNFCLGRWVVGYILGDYVV